MELTEKQISEKLKRLHTLGHHDISNAELRKRTEGIDNFDRQMKDYEHRKSHDPMYPNSQKNKGGKS